MSTFTVGAHDEEASVQLEREGNKWKGEFVRMSQAKQGAPLKRNNLERRLKDAEADMARAQRLHAKELITHKSELSDQKVKCADLTGYARAMGKSHRPRGTFSTCTPSPQGDGDVFLKSLMDILQSQYPPPLNSFGHFGNAGPPGYGF